MLSSKSSRTQQFENANFLLTYKLRFLTFCLILAYTFAHTKLTGIYADSQLQDLINGVARLPFGQRLLVPYLARLIHTLVPSIRISDLFFSLELGFTALFYFALARLLSEFFTPKLAQILSWIFLLLLPLVTIVSYRYRFFIPGDATFFNPYDTPTLFFMAAGYWLCLCQRWPWLIVTIFFATLNRESSILLVALIPVLHAKKTLKIIKPLGFSCLSYIAAKSLILWLTATLPGHYFELSHTNSSNTYFILNLHWLFTMAYFPLLTLAMAGLPILWFCFFDFIPPQFRPLRYLTALYFIGLIFCGLVMEARIFEEIVILLYLPVCLAVERWLKDQEPYNRNNLSLTYYLKRYIIMFIFLIIVLCKTMINYYLQNI